MRLNAISDNIMNSVHMTVFLDNHYRIVEQESRTLKKQNEVLIREQKVNVCIVPINNRNKNIFSTQLIFLSFIPILFREMWKVL